MFELIEIIGIACAGDDFSIGRDNDLLWRSKKDMKFVKEITTGNAIVMGRKTFESLPNGALPNRLNIVLTRSPDLYENKDNLYFVKDIGEAIRVTTGTNKIFVFGGSEIYDLLEPMISTFYLTKVENQCNDADSFLPDAYAGPKWWNDKTEILESWSENGLDFSLIKLVSIPPNC